MSDQIPPYTCADVQQRLNDYLDQELPPQETCAMLAHIGDCAACAALSQRNYLALAQLRAAVQSIALPTGLASRLSERLDACRQKP